MSLLKWNRVFIILLCISFLLSACGDSPVYVPRPRGYPDIRVPDHLYQPYDSNCPFLFDYSEHAEIKPFTRGGNVDPCWFDIHYPAFKATIHVTYSGIKNNLKSFIDDAHKLAYAHVNMSDAIDPYPVMDPNSNVFGMLFDLSGDPATPYQFYLTDSTRHFFRAALYFDFNPNYDSLAPVVEFLKGDVDHLIETFEWKKTR